MYLICMYEDFVGIKMSLYIQTWNVHESALMFPSRLISLEKGYWGFLSFLI